MKNIQTLVKYVSVSLGALALGVFGLQGTALLAYTQTTPSTSQNVSVSDFKHDVEKGIQEVNNDEDAQNNQQEIDNEDQEGAGDEHGDVNEIDGENNQSEIDNEIEQEVEQEDGNQGERQDKSESEGQSGVETNTN